MNEQNLKEIFSTHKVDMPNDGFSRRIITHLPERKSILPQVVMISFIVVGMILTFAVQGIDSVLNNINSLVFLISRMQIPSAISVITILGILSLTGLIAHSILQVEAE
jgi:hypothetical protein